jgi:hypothetical protein
MASILLKSAYNQFDCSMYQLKNSPTLSAIISMDITQIERTFFNQAERKYRENFQYWLKPIIALLHDPEEIINVSITQGDGGLDIVAPKQGVVYQMYAPNHKCKDSEIAKKIYNNFPKALEKLGGSLTAWYLIIHRRMEDKEKEKETVIALTKSYASVKETHPNINLSVWSLDDVWKNILLPHEKSQQRLKSLQRILSRDAEFSVYSEQTKSTAHIIQTELSNHIIAPKHAGLAFDWDESSRRLYLQGLTIVVAAMPSYSFQQESYIQALCKSFNIDALLPISYWVENTSPVPVSGLKILLNSAQKQFCWLADATYLLCMDNTVPDRTTGTLEIFARVYGISLNDADHFFQHMQIIAVERDPIRLFESIKIVTRKTLQWKTILAHRGLRIGTVLNNLSENKLWDLCKTEMGLMQKIGEQQWKIINGIAMGGEGLIQRAALYVIRTSCNSSLKDIKEQVRTFEATHNAFANEANKTLRIFGDAPIILNQSMDDIQQDENTSLENEAWSDNMEKAYQKLSAYLDNISNRTSTLSSKLSGYILNY